MSIERKNSDRLEIIMNPDDPKFGEFAFTAYDRLHPITGGRERDAARKALRGWNRHDVTVGVIGWKKDWKTRKVVTWRGYEHTRLTSYSDIFGSDGAVLRIIKKNYAKTTKWEIVIQKITISKE